MLTCIKFISRKISHFWWSMKWKKMRRKAPQLPTLSTKSTVSEIPTCMAVSSLIWGMRGLDVSIHILCHIICVLFLHHRDITLLHSALLTTSILFTHLLTLHLHLSVINISITIRANEKFHQWTLGKLVSWTEIAVDCSTDLLNEILKQFLSEYIHINIFDLFLWKIQNQSVQ